MNWEKEYAKLYLDFLTKWKAKYEEMLADMTKLVDDVADIEDIPWSISRASSEEMLSARTEIRFSLTMIESRMEAFQRVIDEP